jgi:hypothetical protein
MTTEWIRKHVKPSLVAQYEAEMAKLRGEESTAEHIVKNIKKLNEEVEKIESDEDRRQRDLAEDEEMERFFRKNK